MLRPPPLHRRMESPLPRIDINGCPIEVLSQGRGQPVILLHSTASSSAQWRTLAERLAGRYHVLAPDFHGCGASTPWAGDGAFWLADEAAIVHALMEQLDEPVHLVGHSYGGAVALQVARRRGDDLRSLTLIEPVAFHLLADGDAADRAALAEIAAVADAMQRALACGDYQGGLARFVDYWNGSGSWARIPTAKRRRLAGALAKVTLDFHATIHDPRRLRDFERLSAPTLLLQGSATTTPAQRICERLALALPWAHTHEIDGAGHMAPLTHPDAVNALIEAHLDAYAGEERLAA